jgi:uncharacterized protein YdeI (YjbR/CyaY-like superfamily)
MINIFYPPDRAAWRQWLSDNHTTASEVWVQTWRKSSGRPSLPYDDLVEECLCFGWIDGVVKKYEPDSTVQRITPRRKKTFLSELNRQRIWKLQRLGLMTAAGIAPVADQIGHPDEPFDIPEWIVAALQADPAVWAQFQAFPRLYQRLKIGWIGEIKGAGRAGEVQKRLAWLIKMTRQGKMYGTVPEVF